MSMRKGLFLALLTCLLLPAASLAQSIYVSAMRGQAGAENVMSGLYSVNLANGAATFVAPLRTADGKPVAITGLGVEPATQVFYGITSNLSPASPQSLVKLEPQS